jgi:uncharacterized membrane-anchored protein YitT (DUF2179 family)
MIDNKDLLARWGENTAYSAKCHFKMSDLNRYWVYVLILVNILFAIFSLLDFDAESNKATLFSVTSLIASVLLLVHESQRNSNMELNHKEAGEAYLEIHYDVEKLYAQSKVSNSDVELIKERIQTLNKTSRPSTNFIAKWWATRSIEKTGEMHKWWKNG